MRLVNPTFFASQPEFHRWLEREHAKSLELVLGFHKKGAGAAGIARGEAVDEALCFGWIDGRVNSLGDTSYAIRFTPRQRGSTWSAVNIRRAGELIKLRLMQPSGLAAFEARKEARSRIYSYEQAPKEFDTSMQAMFGANRAAWTFFQKQPASYHRVTVHWVTTAKQEITRQRRLGQLIAASERGERLPQFVSPGRRTGEG